MTRAGRAMTSHNHLRLFNLTMRPSASIIFSIFFRGPNSCRIGTTQLPYRRGARTIEPECFETGRRAAAAPREIFRRRVAEALRQ